MYNQLLLSCSKASYSVFLVKTELYPTGTMGCRHTVHILNHPFCRLTAKARDPSISNCVQIPCVFNLQGSEKWQTAPSCCVLSCSHLFRVQHSAQNYHPMPLVHPGEVTLNVVVKAAL